MAACINFVVFYVVGLPIGISLAVLTDLNTLGMWIGLSIASFSQVSQFYSVLTVFIKLFCQLGCDISGDSV